MSGPSAVAVVITMQISIVPSPAKRREGGLFGSVRFLPCRGRREARELRFAAASENRRMIGCGPEISPKHHQPKQTVSADLNPFVWPVANVRCMSGYQMLGGCLLSSVLHVTSNGQATQWRALLDGPLSLRGRIRAKCARSSANSVVCPLIQYRQNGTTSRINPRCVAFREQSMDLQCPETQMHPL